MKTPLATLLLFLTLFGACKKDSEEIGPCGVKNPIEELPWLKEEIERLSKSTSGNYAFATIVYKGERVFWLYAPWEASDFSTYRTCDNKFRYVDFTKPMDEETKRFAELLRNPTLACPYLIWSSPVFQQYSTCP